jgi:chromatin segregation and condensation protein Rec8/ScpA/Scc1 (kleisin family)
MMEVLNILKREGGRVVFHKVVPEVTSRGSVIVSFIALLELCKRSVIRVQQDAMNEDIWIVLADSADAGVVSNALMESEFDDQPSAAQAVNH